MCKGARRAPDGPIKFIHSSDFHLDQSIKGLTELSPHLVETLANAPYIAAQKVFDLAIAERVDFLLLSGDLYDSESGSARASAFFSVSLNVLRKKRLRSIGAVANRIIPIVGRAPSSFRKMC